jgi:hypothetical protein
MSQRDHDLEHIQQELAFEIEQIPTLRVSEGSTL